MIAKRIISRRILPKTLVFPIVIVVHLLSRPVVALYSEMVVALGSKTRLSGTGLKKSLGKSYAGGNSGTVHFGNGDPGIFADICLLRRTDVRKRRRGTKEGKNKAYEYISLHISVNTNVGALASGRRRKISQS